MAMEADPTSTTFRSTTTFSNHDVLVMGTAEDAVRAKHAAAAAGYYQDPYIAAFADGAATAAATRTASLSKQQRQQRQQQPAVQVIIKRGTFARVACIHKAVTTFLNETKSAAAQQVLVLGSGKDTSFFRVLDELSSLQRNDRGAGRQGGGLRWFEVDHDEVLREKMAVIRKNPSIFRANTVVHKSDDANNDLYEIVQSVGGSCENRWVDATTCRLVAHDLKDDPDGLVRQKLIRQAGMDPSLPTLVVLECVQMYLPVTSVTNLLKAITCAFTDCTLVSYEPILGAASDDAFGRMMQENLTKAGVVLRGESESCLVQIRTLRQALLHFVQSAGFVRAVGCDMYAAYETVLSAAQRQTAHRCEFLDELEEFTLIMRHYCFIVASNNNHSMVGQNMCAVGQNNESSLMGFVSGRCEELSAVKEATD